MDLLGRKRKKREATEEAYNKALETFKIEQSWRTPAMESEIILKALVSDGPQRDPLQIDIAKPRTQIYVEDPRGRIGYSRVITQADRQRSRQDLLWEKLIEYPIVEVFYKDGKLALRVDKVRARELQDTATLYVKNPKLIYNKAKNRVTDKYLERRRLFDAALFV